MSLKRIIGTILLCGSILIGIGCAKNKPLVSNKTSELTTKQTIKYTKPTTKQKIEYLVEKQKQGGYSRDPKLGFGTGNFIHSTAFSGSDVLYRKYEDCIQIGRSLFGTIIKDRGKEYDLHIFADDIILGDKYGDGHIDFGHVMRNRTIDFFHDRFYINGYAGNKTEKEIPIEGGGSNPQVDRFRDAVLDVLVQKIASGFVSQDTMEQYNAARRNLLESLR